jgi:DNA ligase-1
MQLLDNSMEGIMFFTLSRSKLFGSRNTLSESLALVTCTRQIPYFSNPTFAALISIMCFFTNLTYAQLIETSEKSLRDNATIFSLAERYRADIDLNQYWISEKLDGVRALWNGEKFISRGGNTFRAPDWFTLNFPNNALDGELWIERGGFQKTVSTIRKQNPVDEEWQSVTYQVFDLPDNPGPFNSRLLQLEQMASTYSVDSGKSKHYLRLIPQRRVINHQQLTLLLNKLVAKGAEGLMLRHQGSYHRAGRSDDLLKYKPSYDAEAVIVGYRGGKGKYSGTTGSLLVELPSGIRFHIGSGLTDKDRVFPPPIGSVISFRYWGLTKKGIPRHASFLRLRSDANR